MCSYLEEVPTGPRRVLRSRARVMPPTVRVGARLAGRDMTPVSARVKPSHMAWGWGCGAGVAGGDGQQGTGWTVIWVKHGTRGRLGLGKGM